MRRGFSLVELSIVLVILGLLVGGILAGQSLIRAAELRSISADFNRYTAAMAAFKDKYFGLPGDITNATSFWGAADGNDGIGTDCTDLTAATAGTTTCNGDANGVIGLSSSTTNAYERFNAWKQLQNAGLIEGVLSGVKYATGITDRKAVVGWNVPMSRIAGAGFSIANSDGITINGSGIGQGQWVGSYGNILLFGKESPSWESYYAAIRPEDAWNIDVKMDDGLPGGGRLLSLTGGGSSEAPNCANTANPAVAVYQLSTTTIACSFIYKTGL